MYAYIYGEVNFKSTNYVVIDVGGIGYKIFADTFTINSLNTGEKAKIYTYLRVSQDDLALYGFAGQEQKTMFEKLITISGIGPKVAMSVLSSMRPNDIAAAIISSDEKAFSNVSGIGKKTAQRLILELKEKVDFELATGADIDGSILTQDIVQEAAAALASLGYNRQEAVAAVAAVKNLGDSAEELVLLALKRLDS
ncbi:MAG: Holliday junction branch migration protein RuvA [Christensenellaceae bacterium]